MTKVLEVVPLRSFVAVADCGGYHRAAKSLHLSQPTISQHVRRLEVAAGQALMERDGRHSKLTPMGEVLLTEARKILAVHDETLRRLGANTEDELIVGSTEHAADQLLPELSTALQDCYEVGQVRFRLDRGVRLRDSLDRGDIDLALLLGAADDAQSLGAGNLNLHWYSAPGWSTPTDGQPLPVVAFDEPCALRKRALDTLAKNHRPAAVVCDAAYLAGVLAAARAGIGVALLATAGKTPEGLVRRSDLPIVQPMPISVRTRKGLRTDVAKAVARAVNDVLDTQPRLTA